MKAKLVSSILLLVFSISAGIVKAQEITLKFNFPKGKTYTQTSQIITEINQSMMGREMKQNQEISTTSEYKIEDVDKDGNATIILSVLNSTMHNVVAGFMDTTIKMDDLKDVKRVRGKLRIFGLNEELCYKPDIYTHLGIYYRTTSLSSCRYRM